MSLRMIDIDLTKEEAHLCRKVIRLVLNLQLNYPLEDIEISDNAKLWDLLEKFEVD